MTGNFNPHKNGHFFKEGDGAIRSKTPQVACDLHDGKEFKRGYAGRIGYNKTIGKFPEYQPNPMKFLTRKKPVEGEEEDSKRAFRKTHNFKSRPTPGIACNLRNIKSAYPSVFRR